MQIAPWEMMDEGETAVQQQQQQQQYGGPLQPASLIGDTANMANDANATVIDNNQLPASLHSQVGCSTEAANPLL